MQPLHHCPACGAPVERLALDPNELGPVSAAVFRLLYGRLGAWVETEALIERIWGSAASANPGNNLAALVCKMNARLAPHGLAAHGRKHLGYRMVRT